MLHESCSKCVLPQLLLPVRMHTTSRVVRFVVKGTRSRGVGTLTAGTCIRASSTAICDFELCCHLALTSLFVTVAVIVALSVLSVVFVFPFAVTCDCCYQTTVGGARGRLRGETTNLICRVNAEAFASVSSK